MPTTSYGTFRWLFRRAACLENFADRLNHFWTFGLLLLLACIISWRHTYNKPIHCWVPIEFSEGMQQYADDICWYQTYIHLPLDENIPISVYTLTQMSRTRVLHQWLPIILCFQALLFKLPNLLMYILHGYSGISFEKIASLTSGFENISMQERDILGKQTAHYIYNWCKQFENWLPWRFLTVLWFLVKILYCANIIVQISLVNMFLVSRDPLKVGNSYSDVIRGNLFSNDASLWTDSPAFPRQTLCDFQIRQTNNIHFYTTQCHLNANHFNESVYMFLWVWFVFVAIATCLSVIIWTLRTIIPISRKRLPRHKDLLKMPHSGTVHPLSRSLTLVVVELSADSYKVKEFYQKLCPSSSNLGKQVLENSIRWPGGNGVFGVNKKVKIPLRPLKWRYIKKLLELADDPNITAIRPHELAKFCNVIGEDGVMALKLIGSNSSEHLVSNVVCNMWMLRMRVHNQQQTGQILPEMPVQPSTPQGSGTPHGANVHHK